MVIKFGAIFKHANKLEQHFKEICIENGMSESELCKPSAVVLNRWYSFYDSALVTRKLWQFFMIFIDHPHTQGEKAKELLELLGNNESRQILYVKLVFITEVLQPIHSIQKLLESGEPLIHRMNHIVGTNLQSEITKYSDLNSFTLGSEITSVLNMLPATQVQILKEVPYREMAGYLSTKSLT